MPGEDGVCLARDLRTHDATPILLLTAMGEPDERIAGLESGVDDYLVKPFEPRELLLRLGNILRRAANDGPGAGEVVRFGAFRFDPGHRLLTENDMPVRLTEAESGLWRYWRRRRASRSRVTNWPPAMARPVIAGPSMCRSASPPQD